jgi:hypothetical protein
MTVYVNGRKQSVTIPLTGTDVSATTQEIARNYVDAKQRSEQLLSDLRQAVNFQVQR